MVVSLLMSAPVRAAILFGATTVCTAHPRMETRILRLADLLEMELAWEVVRVTQQPDVC